MVKALVEYRKERGLTQVQLAERLGVSQATIAMYETGTRTPTLRAAKRIADFFNVRIDDIDFLHRETGREKAA